MNHQMFIDYDDGSITIRCPFWANDLVHRLPSRRWSKTKRHWVVPLLRQSVTVLRELITLAGVQTSGNAENAMTEYDRKAAKLKATGVEFPPWYKFKGSPRKHQSRALNKKWSLPAFALHADRGTGKTFVLINYGCAKRMEGAIDAMLVVVKLSGRRTWAEELEKFATIPYDAYLPEAGDTKNFERWLGRKHDFKILVVGVESLSQGRMPKLVERFILTVGKVYMVVDESHLIFNHRALRTKECIRLGTMCKLRDTSTGTPISTGPLNLFSQFEFLDPEIIGIGDFYAFRNRYAVVLKKETKQGQKFPMIIGYQNLDELTRIVAPFTFEVRKADVLDLPPKVYERSYLKLTQAQQDLYDTIRRDKAYEWKDKERVIKNVLELVLRLHQVCGGFITTHEYEKYIGRGGTEKVRTLATWHPIVPIDRNPKIQELLELCEDNKQFIIWAAYKPEIFAIVKALRQAYPKEQVVEVHGGIEEGQRAEYRQLYQKGDAKYMVGNTATGGTSDTWTACETMVYYNNTERMIDREQSEDRAHRDGLDHSVLYLDLIMEKTVEETIIKSIEQKVDLAEYVRRNIRNAANLLDGTA